MGATLYASERVYREAVDRCAALLEPQLGLDLRSVIYADSSSRQIHETRFAQPALFVTEYALATLWASWGIQPTAMLGHSIGEYTAAHLSGVMSLEDALGVVALRGSLMQGMPPGGMAAVPMSPARLQQQLNNGVEIAAANAPELCTVSGPVEAVAELVQRLAKSGVQARVLHTSHAFHSRMMQPVLAPFTEYMRGIKLNPPMIPISPTSRAIGSARPRRCRLSTMRRHLRRAVKFEAGLRVLGADSPSCLLELGPGNALTTFARLTLTRQERTRALHSMARAGEGRADATVVREAAAKLWLAGGALNFVGMHADSKPYRVPLPTYPFERQRYWVNAKAAQAMPAMPAQERAHGIADWLYAPTWMRDDSGVADAVCLTGNWLVLGDEDPLTVEVLAQLRAAGAAAILVRRGAAYQRLDAAHFITRHHSAEDMALLGKATSPVGVIHLWGITRDALAARGVYDALVALGVGLASDIGGESLHVLHASTGVASILDETAQQPLCALALGPILVLPTEHPGLHLRMVDLEVGDGMPDARRAAFALLREAAVHDGSIRSAWRGGRRWVIRHERVVLPAFEAAGSPLKRHGVYLITGGLGGIGLSLAKWLARDFKARLLLTARSGLPPRMEWDSLLASRSERGRIADAISGIRAIEADGGEVIVAAADAADERAMEAAISAAVDNGARWTV